MERLGPSTARAFSPIRLGIVAAGLVAAATACEPSTQTERPADTGSAPNSPGERTTSSEAGPTGGPDADTERTRIDLRDLRDRGALADIESVEVTVESDPAYGGRRFRGWPLEALLDRFAEMPEQPADFVIQFVATDGYRATVPLEKLPADRGVIAFRDLEARDDERWGTFAHGDEQTTAAPFYLVWPDADEGETPNRPWAYKLVAIEIAREDELWGAAVPDRGGELEAGFAVFRDHCIKCHAVNRSGGAVGPELNVPMSVTEYWRPKHLARYIRHPRRYRAGAEMPSMDQLSDGEMDDLLEYLRGMAEAKVCDSPSACRKVPRRGTSGNQ